MASTLHLDASNQPMTDFVKKLTFCVKQLAILTFTVISLEEITQMGIALIRTRALDGWKDVLSANNVRLTKSIENLIARQQSTSTGHDAIALSEFVEFLEEVSLASRKPGLSWTAGSMADYSTRGAIGRTVLSSKTLGTGFRRLTTYFPLLQDATELKLDIKESWTTLSYRILDPDIWPRHNDALYSLGIYSSLLKHAAPDAWRDAEITLEASNEQYQCNVSSIVQANCIYGGDTNSLRFPTRALEETLAAAVSEPRTIEDLNRRLIKLKRQTPIADRVRHVIYRDMNEGYVAQDKVASELGMTSRTLRRKLSAANLSYQAILDDCRMRLAALEFRTRKSASLSEIALRLGYSEHSTFTRAFARWAGMPPQEYKSSLILN